jgi:hypothetical protein
MKIRSALLGSVALAGLTTAGYAADLGVVTSLDVCDELGLSGLTVSSDDNCLVITGGVTFEYDWGNYEPGFVLNTFARTGNTITIIDDAGGLDSNADVDAWLQFVATADSDFGPASATIKLISEDNTGTADWTVGIDQAWVSIGDTTQLMAGYKKSIFNVGDDGPLNYLGLFNASDVNTGVGFASSVATGGDVIQVVSNLGNGISVGGGLEALGTPAGALSLVGVLNYAGDGVTAHVSSAYATGTGLWNIHAGFTGAWDPIKVVGAVAADSTGWWNALGSVSATFDMFTLAASGEATSAGEWGAGGSVGATVTDGVTINLGGRYFQGVADSTGQVEAGISAAVTETITLTAAAGYYTSTIGGGVSAFYGKAGLAWAPGGGFTASTDLTVNSIGGYKAVFKAAKTIK